MFGWINDCTECLVVSKFGDEAWHKIKENAGCTVEDGGFLRYKYYPDGDTVALVVAASGVLGITVDEVLHAFGDYFIDYVQDNGYSNVLECLGGNLRDWLSNLNSLHDHLQASYPKGFVAPVFWSEDEASKEEQGAILVYYYSQRGSLLVPLVVGLLKKIARAYFDIEINLEQLTLQDEVVADTPSENADGKPKTHKHTSWRVTTVNPEESHKLRGKKRRPRMAGEDKDDGTVTTAISSTSTMVRNKYERTFQEGGAQASFLRVEEFVQRAFFNKDCELYHALTLEQYVHLVEYWKNNKLPPRNSANTDNPPEEDDDAMNMWCYEIWSIEEEDTASWPSLKDLPPKINPASMGGDPVRFGGQVPATGAFPPNDKNELQSFPAKIRVMNSMRSSEFVDLAFSVPKDGESVMSWSLEQAVANAPSVQDAKIAEFDDDVVQQLDSGAADVQWAVWNDATDDAYHTFTRGDLAVTSLQQLYDLISAANFDPVKLVIQVVESVEVDDDEEDI